MPTRAARTAAPIPADAVADRRTALFRETPAETMERIVLGTAYALRPRRIGDLLPLTKLWLSDLVSPQRDLPDPNVTLAAGELAGMVHDVSVPTLVEAYKRGLFTFAHFGPLKWISPPERCVLLFDDFHISKRLRRVMRQGQYTVTFDRDFDGVMKTCAGRRDGKWHVTWITPHIMRTYAAMHDAGHAHSFEVWNAEGALVGGGFGTDIGGVFYTESQFSLEPNTSKLGFTVLNWHLDQWGYALNDGKYPTPTILDMGFQSIPRADFLRRVAAATANDRPLGRWQVEADLKTIAAWQPGTPKAPSIVPEPAADMSETKVRQVATAS